MRLSFTPLLVYSSSVPVQAREALEAAQLEPPERRNSKLELAARILFRETGLGCRDARELVGLPPGESCA